ncbi:MAG: hypothetical protein KBC43_09930 [Bacteroidales bacterium]|nr:hypothetical protein [Bacteroidales bacterium]
MLAARQHIQPVYIAASVVVCITVIFPGWLFSQDTTAKLSEKPFSIHGNISLNLIGYYSRGIPSRSDPFSAILSASATPKIKNFELPFSLVFSGNETGLTHTSQSFSQIGISPRWKWITLHGGYRNVTFSNFTLAGHTFLGGGIELSPGKFRFGFIYGRFDRKTNGSNISTTDKLSHFARRGFAVKLGVGTEKNYFDLLFLRIRDDSSSLQQPDTGTITLPEQNTVAGFNGHFTIARKLTWDMEGAFSLYTTNLAAQTIEEIEEDNTLHSLNKFLGINFSSEYYYAIRSSLQYKERNWGVKLDYRRIEPGYRSMGAYFFNNDVQNITLSPSFALFKRKLTVSGAIGLQEDNLRGTKRATSARTIGNVNISFNPKPKYGFTASYSNYSINQRAGTIPLNDTARGRQATHSFMFTPRFMLITPERSHMVMLVYNLVAGRDRNEFTAPFTRFTSQIAQLNYALGLTKTKWSVNTGITCTLISNYIADITGIGGTIGISKTLLKDKLSIGWINAVTRNNAGSTDAYIYNSNLTATCRAGKHHNFRLYIYFTGNFTGTGSYNPSFNELKGDLSYVFTF